jgi:cysteine desulfurase / selenocysteine lyase
VTDDVAYLDYAATAAVRPPAVAQAVARYLTEIGATPGRAGHRLARSAGRVALHCRQALARRFGLPGDPGRIALLANATHALNAALRGVLRRGDIVVTTDYDHNSVIRPVRALARERDVRERVIPGRPDGSLDLDQAARALVGARLLVVNAASNVLGTALPLSGLARLARSAGALVLVDAAQSAGHIALAADEAADIDLLAVTGHKGLLGPHGTGALWVREGVEIDAFLYGGTGSDSQNDDMPAGLPDRLEAGSLNGEALAGWLAALEWHEAARDRGDAMALKHHLRQGLLGIPGVRVLSPPAPDGVPIVSMTADALDAATVARRLDDEAGVLVRAGLHCAPRVHRLLGTLQHGAVRFSLGWASTSADVERAVEGVARILETATRQAPAAPRPAGAAHGSGRGTA